MLIPNPSDLPALFEAPEVEEEMQEMPKKKRRNADRLSNFSNGTTENKNTTTIPQLYSHDSMIQMERHGRISFLRQSLQC